jgi:hypothetical protein
MLRPGGITESFSASARPVGIRPARERAPILDGKAARKRPLSALGARRLTRRAPI